MFPKAAAQLFIVHMVRYSLNFVGWELRKTVAAGLRTIYQAATVEAAAIRLTEFDAKRGADYPSIVQSWQRNWLDIVPFFDYPAEIRKVIYTTNAIEEVATSHNMSVNMNQRLAPQSRGSFPNDDATIGAVLSGTARYQQEMDDADSELESGVKSVHYHVRMCDERMPQH